MPEVTEMIVSDTSTTANTGGQTESSVIMTTGNYAYGNDILLFYVMIYYDIF